MTDPEGNLTAQQGRWHAAFGVQAVSCCCENRAHSLQHWARVENLNKRDAEILEAIQILEARLSQALEERDAWKQRFEDDAHDFHEMSEQLNAALEAARIAEAKAALADEAYWMVEAFDVLGTSSGGKQYEQEEAERRSWLARYDALTPAADAAEETI